MRAKRFMKHAQPPARKLKKQTQKHQRLMDARRKTAMASVAAIAQGCAGQIVDACKRESEQTAELKRTQDQVQRIVKWSDTCLDRLEIGKKGLDTAFARFNAVEDMLKDKIADLDGVSQHAATWIMISFLCDDCRDRYADKSREWNYFAGCVATWTGKLLAECRWKSRVESIGGELGEKAWEIILK